MKYYEISNWIEKPALKKLLDLSTPPKHLYATGKWDADIFNKCVAIVGSRKMTLYGEKVIEKLVPILVAKQYTIVSGFMYGVDQYVHKMCVDTGGRTIAVLGWGIDTPLTGEDQKLAKEIVDTNGLLLSEWETQKAAHWTFPARNRIVAALCDSVYVVEAAEHSGSLITAKLAEKLNRDLWAVPGPITSRTSLGTNMLIQQGKAKMWLGDDVPITPSLAIEDPILRVLENDMLAIDDLYRKINLPVSEIGAKLSILILQGQVGEKEGKYYKLC